MSTLEKNDSMPTTGAIRIEDVVKVYDPDGAAVMAVDHCSIDIPAGEICMIVGPSGCGKTTLLEYHCWFSWVNFWAYLFR